MNVSSVKDISTPYDIGLVTKSYKSIVINYVSEYTLK